MKKKKLKTLKKVSTLFLDIDGVIRIDGIWVNANINALNEILTITNAQIVLTSDWRKAYSLIEMNEIFESLGIKYKIIGFTPIISSVGQPPIDYLEATRAKEIESYRSDHAIVDNYAIVDDIDVYNNEFVKRTTKDKHFVLTMFYTGIYSPDVKKKLIKLLQ
jgi:hypothetical protein